VDDYPFGGGPGMILRPDILEQALMDGVVKKGGYKSVEELEVIYTSARGKLWNADEAKSLEKNYWREDSKKDLVFLCGRYEGVDERFLETFVTREYSLGNFVLTGGELAVMTILDSALRFTEGSLGNDESSREDSFEDGFLDYPQYTRPSTWQGISVPEVLTSGHHANIEKWKKDQKFDQTKKYKPEILKDSESNEKK
jgi:tRNA (guanine37-N1)-methyltransferase